MGVSLVPQQPNKHSKLYFFLDFLDGTLPPSLRASDRPMAIACLRLVTFFPERPLFKVPLFRSCIAFLTFRDAFFPYLGITTPHSVRPVYVDRMNHSASVAHSASLA